MNYHYKRVIAATHSFKFTVFLQNRNCNKEILIIIIIPPWFQKPIHWKKFVIWRHHFQPSIFSLIVSLLRGNTCSNPHIKESVFIWQHFFATIHYNKRSVVDSRKSWRVCLFEENYCSPALLKVPIRFHRTSCNNFCSESTVLNAQQHLQRSQSFMVN